MFSLLQSHPSAIGLDISDRSIKLIELGKSHGWIPIAIAEATFAPGIISADEIQDEKKLIQILKQLFAHPVYGKFTTRNVVASLSEPKCFVRVIPLPVIPDKELGNAVQFEAEQYVPLPMSDVYLDWQKVEGNFGDIRKTYVLITAVPKQYVDRMLHMLDSARLKAVALEVESQATARSLISEQAPDQAVLILDIATSRTSIIIFDSGVLEFTASVPLGGQALTEAIARNLGIPTEEAEELKRRVGVSPGPAYQQVAGAMKPVLESLLAEIRNAMRFQEEHSLSRKKVQRILLSGGGARLSGLTGWLSSAFSNEVNVALGDPFCRFAKDGRKFPKPLSPEESLGFTTAIGLALRLMQ